MALSCSVSILSGIEHQTAMQVISSAACQANARPLTPHPAPTLGQPLPTDGACNSRFGISHQGASRNLLKICSRINYFHDYAPFNNQRASRKVLKMDYELAVIG